MKNCINNEAFQHNMLLEQKYMSIHNRLIDMRSGSLALSKEFQALEKEYLKAHKEWLNDLCENGHEFIVGCNN